MGTSTRLSIATMTNPPTGNSEVTRTASAPGPPRRVFEFWSWSTLLWFLVVLAAALTAQAVVADYWGHVVERPADRPLLLLYPWIDSRAAMTALVGTLGLAIARANLALGLRPYLSYSNLSPKAEEKPPKYRVLLRNEGTGPAVIVRMMYKLRRQGDPLESILEHETVVRRIEDICGLKEGADYNLTRFSSGATIGKDKDRSVLEVNIDAIDRLLVLWDFDVEVQYKGLLGDLFQKTLHCLPRAEYRRPKGASLAS
jgi:hypothetical protein